MRLAFAMLCAVSLFAITSEAQTTPVVPLRIAAGTVVTFHVQSRLRTAGDDALGAIPQGTQLHVKIVDSIDSAQDRDGSAFRGLLVSSIVSDGTVIHADAEVRGLLVLLRSKDHPEGFRYELMVTAIVEDGVSYPLTATLSASLFDSKPVAVAAARKSANSSRTP